MRIPAGAENLLRRLSGALVSRAAWMIPRRWFWLAFLAGAVAMSCAPHMARANGSPGTLTASSVSNISRGPTGLSGTLNAVLIETERRSYHSASLRVPWGTLGAAAKAGARGVARFSPYVGLAMVAADMAGWVKENDWYHKNDGDDGTDPPASAYYICIDRGLVAVPADYCVEGTEGGAGRLASFLVGKASSEPQAPQSQGKITTATPGQLFGKHNVFVTFKNTAGTTTRNGWMRNVVAAEKPAGSKNTDYVPHTQVSETEMAEAMGQNPANHYEMLHDRNGIPHPFPEVVDALNGMASNIGSATGATPVVGVSPVVPGNTSPTDPAPSSGGQGSELPAFCEWARVVCDFIDWYKDEGEPLDEVEVPFEEETMEMQDWSSGQSGGSCPAPESVTVMGEAIEFSYQPICDLADLLYGINIAGALVIAGFIVAGLRK